MKYFFDTEFIEKPNTINLISIGIVSEEGDSYYAVCSDFNAETAWNNGWIRENVLKTIFKDFLKIEASNDVTSTDGKFTLANFQVLKSIYSLTTSTIKKEILAFIEPNPTFYAYYSAYDWVVFCWIFGRMIDLPEGYPMYCYDLKTMMDREGLDTAWKNKMVPEGDNEHNALADAWWNLDLYEAITKETAVTNDK